MASASLNKMTVPLASDQSQGSTGILMPKLKYRFRVIFENFGVQGGPVTEMTKQVIDFTRPTVTFENIDLPVERGNHCNYNTNKLLLVLNGIILVKIEDVIGNKQTKILEYGDYYYIPKNTWIHYTVLDKKTNILVLCDTTFEEQINITDYSIFKGI